MHIVDKEEVVTPAESTEIAVTSEERLTIENIQLKMQILQGQLDSFMKQLVLKYEITDHEGFYYLSGKFTKIMTDELKAESQ